MNLLCILLLLFFLPSEGKTPISFTTNLIHRDSPSSPFYNPSITHFDRLQDAYNRSLKRVNHLKSALTTPSEIIDSPIVFSDLEYFMKISIGTPPIDMVALIDTGSDLTWTQCQPTPTPLFYDPGRSSSYQTVPCNTGSCKILDKSFCGDMNTCAYNYSYADGGYTAGKLAYETFTLGSTNPVSFRCILYGCSEYKKGSKDDGTGGVVGLGRGNISFISQIGESIGGKKFSYCLAPSNSTGKISFGKDSMPSGEGIVTTPILTKSSDNYTYFALEGFSVGSQKIGDNGETKTVVADYVKFVGDIIIDSGTTYTLLPKETFDNLVSVVDKVINATKVGQRGLFANCYKDDGNINLPTITVHVKGGDFELTPLNTFTRSSDDDAVCLAMIWTDFPVYGNLAQTNFNVGFDLDAGTLSFQPSDCTK